MKKRNRIILLSFLVLALAEYVLIDWTRNFGADSSVVSHVGFAGTIVSIVLAIVAIVYSYYQTSTQQRDSASLSEQLRNLQGISQTLGTSSSLIQQQGRELVAIQDQIQESLNASKRTEQSVASIQNDVAAIKSMNDLQAATAPRPTKTKSSAAASEALAELSLRLISKAISSQMGYYMALIYVSDNNLTSRDYGSLIARAVKDKLTAEGKPGIAPTLAEWYDGVASGQFDVLVDLDLITLEWIDPVAHKGVRPKISAEFRNALTAARPTFVDVSDDRMTLDLASIEKEIARMKAAT